MLQISTWKKTHHNLPIQVSIAKDSALTEQNINKKNHQKTNKTRKPHIHTLTYHSTSFKSANTRWMRAHKNAGVPMRKESVPDSQFWAIEDWIHNIAQQKIDDGETALTAHTPNLCWVPLQASRWKSSKLWEDRLSMVSSCLRFILKKVSAQQKKNLSLPKALAYTSSSAKYQTTQVTHSTRGTVWYL